MRKLALLLFTFLTHLAACYAIVGGQAVEASDPISRQALRLYITAVMGGTPLECTGTALTPRVVLTAAHCLENYSFIDLQFEDADGKTETYNVIDAIAHPGFSLKADRNPDIALLFLNYDLPSSVQIMKLPEAGQNLKLTKILTAGYGKRSGVADENPKSGDLHKVELDVTHYSPTAFFIEVDQSQGKALCKGDSGGPAIWKNENETYVVGVIKGGLPTKQEPLPESKQDRCNGRGFFVNLQLPVYLDWIQEQIASHK
jgi:secreted trypsin-like serine protease